MSDSDLEAKLEYLEGMFNEAKTKTDNLTEFVEERNAKLERIEKLLDERDALPEDEQEDMSTFIDKLIAC
jgi:hypothetical protein